MESEDPDRARSRFIRAVQRCIAGARLQRERIITNADAAPRLLAGTNYEVVDLTAVPDNDFDYYIYELTRMREAARTTIRVFDEPRSVVEALQQFDAAVPRLREIRNPLTHPSDDNRLDDVSWFSADFRLKRDRACRIPRRSQV
jgi:hypothetical protein